MLHEISAQFVQLTWQVQITLIVAFAIVVSVVPYLLFNGIAAIFWGWPEPDKTPQTQQQQFRCNATACQAKQNPTAPMSKADLLNAELKRLHDNFRESDMEPECYERMHQLIFAKLDNKSEQCAKDPLAPPL